MNCRDFERLWNDRLDARAAHPAVDAPLDAHASACPACRALAAGFQAVALAAQTLSATPPPDVAPDFADRVLAAFAEGPSPVLRFGPLRRLLPLATAAAVVAAAFVGWKVANVETAPGRPAAVAGVKAIDPDDLSAALADATSATLGLAMEASAPAARAFGAAERLSVGPDSLSLPASVLPASAAALWQGVGLRVNEGVRPISGSARSAFGFLIPPPSARGDRPDGAPALPSEGA